MKSFDEAIAAIRGMTVDDVTAELIKAMRKEKEDALCRLAKCEEENAMLEKRVLKLQTDEEMWRRAAVDNATLYIKDVERMKLEIKGLEDQFDSACKQIESLRTKGYGTND